MAPPRPSPRLADLLGSGSAVLALTGAGVSAESGLATFRGEAGLWEGHDPTEVATPQAFRRDPALVWRFYAARRERAARAEPNAGHRALAALERAHPAFRLVTQNVDGLHERAGSRQVLRLHGSIWRVRCVGGCAEREELGTLAAAPLPRCACGALLRPAVVWFGEPLDPATLAEAERAARRARVVIVAGTSSVVYPAAALPGIARDSGAYVVEVNPERTSLSPLADERLGGSSGEILPLLAELAGVKESG